MICPKCSTYNRNGARYCDTCGYELPSVAAEAHEMFDVDTISIGADSSAVTIDFDDLDAYGGYPDQAYDQTAYVDYGITTSLGATPSVAGRTMPADSSSTRYAYKYGMSQTAELPALEELDKGATQSQQRIVYSASDGKKSPSIDRKKLVAIIIGIVVFLAAAVIGTYVAGIWGGKSVPDVIGMKIDQAEYQLESAGFRVNVIEVKSDEVEGIVLSTDPAAGKRAEEGSEINVEVSSARIIPEIIGMSEEDALAALEQEGLTEIEIIEVKSNEADRTVLSVKPDVGTRCKATSSITVEVAIPFTVPEVAGMSYDEAETVLEDEGYEAEMAYSYSEDIEEGTVVKTDPAAGDELASGSVVTVYVAKSRSSEVIQLTRDFFDGASTFSIGGKDYELSEVKSVAYSGDDTATYTIVARQYEVHVWLFDPNPDKRYGNYETLTGTITWDSSNDISSSNPSIRQTG